MEPVLCFVWEDPTASLPEDVAVSADSDGVKFADGAGNIVMEWEWCAITEFSGNTVDDPELMDNFHVTKHDGTTITVELDDFLTLDTPFREFAKADSNKESSGGETDLTDTDVTDTEDGYPTDSGALQTEETEDDATESEVEAAEQTEDDATESAVETALQTENDEEVGSPQPGAEEETHIKGVVMKLNEQRLASFLHKKSGKKNNNLDALVLELAADGVKVDDIGEYKDDAGDSYFYSAIVGETSYSRSDLSYKIIVLGCKLAGKKPPPKKAEKKTEKKTEKKEDKGKGGDKKKGGGDKKKAKEDKDKAKKEKEKKDKAKEKENEKKERKEKEKAKRAKEERKKKKGEKKANEPEIIVYEDEKRNEIAKIVREFRKSQKVRGLLGEYTRPMFLHKDPVPLSHFPTSKYQGDDENQLPQSCKVVAQDKDDFSYIIEVKQKGIKSTYKLYVTPEDLEDFRSNLPEKELAVAYPLPKKNDKTAVREAKRIEMVGQLLDQQIHDAKKGKMTDVATASVIQLFDKNATVAQLGKKEKSAIKKAEEIVKKKFNEMHALLKQYYEIEKKNSELPDGTDRKDEDREMPMDMEEIPKQSGNVYVNREATKTLKPVRKKLKKLNMELTKAVDQKNRAQSVGKNGGGSTSAHADRLLDLSCLICKEFLRNGQEVRLFPCGHQFHSDIFGAREHLACSEKYLKEGYNHCPTCQKELIYCPKDED
jgi:hypothetical protein